MVAEEGHLTRAAKRLHASPPAISAHIKGLEDELGLTLFQRTPKGMSLTADGVQLKDYADKALAIVKEMVCHAERLRENLTGELRIGINTEIDSLRIPALFSIMKKRHPNLDMHLLQCMTGEVLNKLENGTLDIGFMYGENSSEKISAAELKKLELVIAGPIAWRERLLTANAKDLDQFPWIMTPSDPLYNVASQLFKTYDLPPAQVVLADQETTIKSMIKAGTGISLLLEQDVRQEELEGNLVIWRKDPFFLKLSIACLKRRRDEPLLQTCSSVITEVWTDI